jgi:uncharacterized protein (TIGR02001 family)
LSGAALAEDKLTWSATATGTSDYVFRGISQTDNDPTIQGSLGVGYGLFYAGVWASGLDFAAAGFYDGEIEVDVYGGIKPTWGPLTFDFGVIYYAYPGNGPLPGQGPLSDLEYLEFKAGVSGSPFTNATLGATAYYSDDYFGETGQVWTVEGTAAYTFAAIGPVTPTVSGLIGYQDSEDAAYLAFNGFDSYTYWNAGLALAVEKLTFDFRYWDTDAPDAAASCASDYCAERFVFSATIALP